MNQGYEARRMGFVSIHGGLESFKEQNSQQITDSEAEKDPLVS